METKVPSNEKSVTSHLPQRRDAKRDGAQKHCSQKEMDRIDHDKRIWEKSTAVVAISINKVIYPTFTDGPNRIDRKVLMV